MQGFLFILSKSSKLLNLAISVSWLLMTWRRTTYRQYHQVDMFICRFCNCIKKLGISYFTLRIWFIISFVCILNRSYYLCTWTFTLTAYDILAVTSNVMLTLSWRASPEGWWPRRTQDLAEDMHRIIAHLSHNKNFYYQIPFSIYSLTRS